MFSRWLLCCQFNTHSCQSAFLLPTHCKSLFLASGCCVWMTSAQWKVVEIKIRIEWFTLVNPPNGGRERDQWENPQRYQCWVIFAAFYALRLPESHPNPIYVELSINTVTACVTDPPVTHDNTVSRRLLLTLTGKKLLCIHSSHAYMKLTNLSPFQQDKNKHKNFDCTNHTHTSSLYYESRIYV